MSTSFWWPEVPSGVAPWVYNASLGTRYIPGIGSSEVATQSLTTLASLPAMTFSPFPTEVGRGGSGFGLGISGNSSFITDDPWPSDLPPPPTNSTMETDDGYSLPEMVLITIVAGFLCLLTVVGNCMVMISFKIDKQLQTISNYFLFSLAVADFVVGFFSMPIFTAYILTGRWLLGPHLCDTWLAVDYLASNASVLNLLIISFDRYFSVTRPLTYRARRTPRRAGIMIAAAWVISLVLWPPWIYSWPYIEGTRKVPEGECYIQFIETNNYITFGTAIAAFYVPVTVMCVLYWRIWRETEQRQKDLSNLQAGKKDDSHRSNSSADDQPPLVTAVAGGVGVDLDEWRRSRSESSGALDDLETTYVPTAACLGQYPRGMQFRGTHRNLLTYLQIRLVQFWRYCTKRRRFFDPDGDDDLSYSDASNVVTPGSLDTPIQSSVSRCTSLNVIRDPYATATPTRYQHHPDVTTPLMEKLAWERNCNAKRKSDPFTLPSTPTTNTQGRVHAKRDVCLSRSYGGGSSNYSSGASNSLKQSASRGLSGSEQRLPARSHSADSVFTIVIRLPHESSVDSQDIPSIKMIPVSELFSSSNNQSTSGNGSEIASGMFRDRTTGGNTGNSISHTSRSRTTNRISNETSEQYRRDSDIPSPPPCPRPRSVSQGRPALPATRYLLPPPDSPNEFYSTRINTPNSQRRNNPLTLCGTGCNLPAVNFPKLPLAKPTHLPIHTTTSPWVPRSVMPVAQSPLLTHPKRHSTCNSNFVLAQDEDPSSPAILPLDARIIPKQLARPTPTGYHNQTHHQPMPSSTQQAHAGQASIVPSAALTNTAHYPSGNARGTGTAAHEVGAATVAASPPVSSLTGCSGVSGSSSHLHHQLHYQTPLQQRRNMHAYQPSAPVKKPKKAKKKSQERKQDKKAAKTLSAILLAFILTWTPYNVLVLLKALTPCENECFPKELWDFSYYLCYINSTINPVCYALCNASFRRTYVRILTCKWHTRTKTAVQRGFYN